MKSSRKRHKLECLECGGKFDDDYRNQHEKKKHGGKRCKVQLLGAPSNPFEAAKKSAKKPPEIPENENRKAVQLSDVTDKVEQAAVEDEIRLQPQSAKFDDVEDGDDFHSDHGDLHNDDSNVNDDDMSMSSGDNEFTEIMQQKVVDVSNNENTEHPSNTPNSWAECVAKLNFIVKDLQNINGILQEFKNSSLPNVERFLEQSVHAVTTVKKRSDDFITKASESLNSIKSNVSALQQNELLDLNSLVEHDPAKRPELLTHNQRQFLIGLGPCQPILKFPKNAEIPARKQNCFTQQWYKQYPHLEYSITKDAAFCFVCSLFPNGPDRNYGENAWVSTGLRSWDRFKSTGTKKKGKLSLHFSSKAHQAALMDFCRFTSKDQHVDELLHKKSRAEMVRNEEEKLYNRQIISILFDVARTLSQQGLAFRGDTKESGNFYQIVQLLSRHCEPLKLWLTNTRYRKYHVTYLSDGSQNEFINLLGSQLKNNIAEEVKQATFFSIIADTTPDASHKDRLSLVLRYCKDLHPYERLIEMVEAEDKTGKGLASTIHRLLNQNELILGKLCAQSYDCAAAMSGAYEGVQKHITDLAEHEVIFFPCAAHRINTFVENSIKSSVLVSGFFDALEELYVFFIDSTKRFKILQKELAEIEGALNLRNLSKTRWTARAESVKAIWM